MSTSPIRILLVEDNPADAVLLVEALAEAGLESFETTRAESLAEALGHLGRTAFDAVLLDLSLPDSFGLDTVAQANAASSGVPIVVMTGTDDEATAVEAVRRGAQDFSIKGQVDGRLLARAIRYAVERKLTEQQLKSLNETLEQRVAERTAVATRRAAQLQALASELTRTEQRERRRLAQVLHDDLQQNLYAARLSLGTLRTRIEDASALETVERVDELLSQTITQSRSLTSQLCPPALYEAGLAKALEWLAQHMHETCRLVVQVEADPQVEAETEDLRVLLFEATRELLFNVVKHAGTSNACVTMKAASTGELEIVVSDDGAGFNPAESKGDRAMARGFGLFSIRERLEVLGGRMEVDATLGRGTRVAISRALPRKPRNIQVNSLKGIMPMTVENMITKTRGRRRILLVDDHPMVRRGIADVLNRETDMEVCGEAADVSEALRELERTHPDLVLVDLTLKSGHGIELIERIKASDPQIKTLVSSMHDETLFAERVLQAGAMGYVTKQESPEALVGAIRQVLRGEVYLSPRMTSRLLHRVATGAPSQEDPLKSLSNREIEVYEMIGQGLTIQQIAARLHLSPKTVETHREKVKQKLNLKNSTELNRRAVQWVLEGGRAAVDGGET